MRKIFLKFALILIIPLMFLCSCSKNEQTPIENNQPSIEIQTPPSKEIETPSENTQQPPDDQASKRDLFKLLKRNKKNKRGMSIRLLSCNTGKDPCGFAQNLANKLNVKVIAPNTYYWAYPNGSHIPAEMKENGQIDITRPGKMITFYSGGNKHD